MALTAIDHTIGWLLIGTWFSSLLFGVAMVLYSRYFQTFNSKDKVWLKALVVLQLSMDALGQIGQYIMVYQYGVTHWGDPSFLTVQNYTYAIYLMTTQTCGLTTQLYLIHRVYKLSRNWMIAVFLILCSLLAWSSCVATMIALMFVFKALEQRGNLITYVNLWLSTSAGVDILIALTLVVLLRRMKSEYAETQSFVRRLMVQSISTGSVTSIIAIITVITFVTNQTSNLDVGFAFGLGRLYSITLLTNLLIRKGLASAQHQTSGWQPNHSSSHTQKINFKPTRSGNEGIYVNTIQRVDVDGEKAERQAEGIRMVDLDHADRKQWQDS